MRTVGVEEELLLVDPQSGRPVSMAAQVIAATTVATAASEPDAGGEVEGELQRTMVETQSAVATDLDSVREDLVGWRRRTAGQARRRGAALAAMATSPIASNGVIAANERYERLAERFGVTAHQVLSCGCHVHVGVASDEEGIAAIDRMRVWLPVLLAISANSPFADGQDTSYASYRSQMWVRWPSAGPTDPFGTPEAYHALVAAMVGSGVLLDDGMVYFDARLSHRYPTVEVRIADVCADVEDALVVAALSRGLVDTSVEAWRRGEDAPQVPTALLRLATWQAGREGVDGSLLQPATLTPAPAIEVVGQLVAHVRDALEANGDLELVETGVTRLADVGNGASHQRRTFARTGRLGDVVADAARRTVTFGPDAG
ncbi:MAG: glutamate--cysteine ligase [Lapillicoccus sp.]